MEYHSTEIENFKKERKTGFNWKLAGLAIIVLVLCGIGIVLYNNYQRQAAEEARIRFEEEVRTEKETAVNEIADIAGSYELEDVTIALRTESNRGQDVYYVDITCSNWSSFTSYEMLALYQKMNSEIKDMNLKIGKESGVLLGNVYSDDDIYVITLGSNGKNSTVERNGKVIYEIAAKMKSSGLKSAKTTVRSSSGSKADNVSQEYKNALTKGLSYARNLHMSKRAIYDQLTSSYGEGFSADAAQYAIDNMTGVDWNANALAKARDYYTRMSMSKSAVYDQLTSEYGEQFTASEAQYAIDHLD